MATKQQSQINTPASTMRNRLIAPGYVEVLVIALLTGIICAGATVWLYDRHYAQKVVTVDLQGYIATQRDELLAGEIDDATFRARLDVMEMNFDRVPDNHVILLKEVVIRNADEIEIK